MNKKYNFRDRDFKESNVNRVEDKEVSRETAETEDYSYYSKVLQKPFNTIGELRKAEADYKVKEAAKIAKANEKKTEAVKVENAFKEMNKARESYKKDMKDLTNTYCEDLRKLKENLEAEKAKINASLDEAEKAYQEALKAFTQKYGSFHMTLRDEDTGTETTISSETNSTKDLIDDLFSMGNFFDLFF